MNLIKCYQTNSSWYKGARRNSTPVGILWHDTGAGNPTLKRYVQPLETDANYQEMLALLGVNKYKNDWNHIEHEAGLNAWIGQLADGSVATIQAGDWTMTPWGCGSGSLGSCNGYIKKDGKTTYIGQHWVQFEICDDKYQDREYFDKVYQEAVELTAMICKQYNIDPKGYVVYNGVQVPTILCHADSYKLKLGGNHGDVYGWFNKMGKTMDDVRNDVAALLGKTDSAQEPIFEKLDVVKIREGVTTYTNGKTIASWVHSKTLYVRGFDGSSDKVIISTLKEGAITGTVWAKDLVLVEKADGTPVYPTYEKGKKVKLAPSFVTTEFDCNGNGCCSTTPIDPKLVEYLQDIHDHFNATTNVVSGYRCETYNKKINGATKSRHIAGRAADIRVTGVSPKLVAQYAEQIGIKGIGLYDTDTDGHFVHVDTRESKSFWLGHAQVKVDTFQEPKEEPVTGTSSTGSEEDQEVMWGFLLSMFENEYAVAGVMGNLYAECALRSNNLQQTYEKKLGYTDDTYTAAVDNGTYTNFIKDSAGYGLAQWTYWSRKERLLNYAREHKKSIGDFEMQLNFLWYELINHYSGLVKKLKAVNSVREASDLFLHNFEQPADQSEAVEIKRAAYGENYYNKFHVATGSSKKEPENTSTPIEPSEVEKPAEEFSESWLKKLIIAICNFVLKLLKKE
jgi:hypothetical protein